MSIPSSRFTDNPSQVKAIKGSFRYENGKVDIEFISSNATFDEVRQAQQALIEELTRLMDNEKKCPFHPTKSKTMLT